MPRAPKRISGPLTVGIGASCRVRHTALWTLILHEVASGGRATLSETSGAGREGSSAKRAFQAAIWEGEGDHRTKIRCVRTAAEPHIVQEELSRNAKATNPAARKESLTQPHANGEALERLNGFIATCFLTGLGKPGSSSRPRVSL